MTPNEEHLSMFELDLYFATGASDARVEDHVAECERCSAYLAHLGPLQESAPLPPVRPAAAPASRRARPRALGLALAAGLSLSVVMTALLIFTHETGPAAVAVKGSPAVQLLLRRGDETLPWDGARRVRPGDALGLRVACEDFSHVTVAVASEAAPGRWSSLSTGECPPAGAVLPFTLVVDDEPGRERVAVVFSMSPLGAPALGQAIEQRRLDAGAWVTRFELDKEIAP
jgi:hypothetical protein